jgi:tetratricopeptide (TPR) repeat protein
MRTVGVSWSNAALVAFAVASVAATPTWAAPRAVPANDARRAYEEATAAFGLGRYDEAAEKYETAFGIRPDPALLYNAAQSYRLSGNKPRALELYRNYVRLYPDRPNAPDARNQVAALKKSIEDERSPNGMGHTTAAPPGPPPTLVVPVTPLVSAPPPGPSMMAPPPPTATAAPLLTADAAVSTAPGDPDRDQSLLRRPWFWVAVGAVIVGATVGVLLATRGEKFPDATLMASGN